MIGLVIVSHSAKIAEGVRDLALQMTQDNVRIAIAGGIDDPEHSIGTDPIKVLEAIQAVYHEDGVIILMDLGSAVMSAETAIEFLALEQQEKIHLCEAPLIEGAIAAAVQASIGSPLDLVLQEARASLLSKSKHLGIAITPIEIADSETTPADTDSVESLTVIIPNTHGIHARPAAKIVAIAGQYNATLTICKGDQSVNARSINQVSLLNAKKGDEISFHAVGDDATRALSAIQALIDNNLGDDTPLPEATIALNTTHSSNGVWQGIIASKGLAVGAVYKMTEQLPHISTETPTDLTKESELLKKAITKAVDELQHLIEESKRSIGEQQANIFQAHIMMLQDEHMQEPAFKRILNEGHNAQVAWWDTVEAMAVNYRQADDSYLQARANDVLDVGERVLRQLTSDDKMKFEIPLGSIIVTADLSPSDIAQFNPQHVQGIVTEYGGATSHTAIIARSLGIPTIVGIGNQHNHLQEGQTIIVDANRGQVHTHPTDEQVRDVAEKIKQQHHEQQQLIEQSKQPAVTQDNRQIEIVANIGKAQNSKSLINLGAEGIGLFRTELLFMDHEQAPTEEQQIEAYTTTAENLNGYPIIIRTLDVGGDKAIRYIHIDREDNPFLGYRGIRYWLGNPELARTQLRAICRTSANHNIKVMFPMVGTLEELQQALNLLDDVRQELSSEGLAFDPNMEVGMMIEVPSAVLIADQLAEYIDFFSIGTNDLTQYIMAADRGNIQVNSLVNPFQPAVIRAIKQVIDAGHAKGKWIGMCGEMAGNPLATQLLVGLGLDELSMSAPAIPEVKAIIRHTNYAQAQKIATHILSLTSVQKITDYLKSVTV